MCSSDLYKGDVRAAGVVDPTSDEMIRSESFRGEVTDVDETKITGITYYKGEKGDEVADYTHSTKLGQRNNVKSTSIFFYKGDVRAAGRSEERRGGIEWRSRWSREQ